MSGTSPDNAVPTALQGAQSTPLMRRRSSAFMFRAGRQGSRGPSVPLV